MLGILIIAIVTASMLVIFHPKVADARLWRAPLFMAALCGVA